LISWLKKAFKKIVRAFVHAVIAGLIAFVMSGFNIGAGLAVYAADFAQQLGWNNQGYWRTRIGTPPTFPSAGITLSQIFQGTILSRLFPSPQDLWKYVVPINGFMPMQGSLLNPCTFNINIYGASGDVLKDIQAEISRIFMTGGLSVVFNNQTRGNAGSTNLYIQQSFSNSVLADIRRNNPRAATAGIPGYTPQGGNNSYVSSGTVGSYQGGRIQGEAVVASLGTMIGRVSAHEVIQHRFIGFFFEGLPGPFGNGDITLSGTQREGANFLREWRNPFSSRFNMSMSTARAMRARCP
jgi:hypothetical protein